jgi:plastocyanin
MRRSRSSRWPVVRLLVALVSAWAIPYAPAWGEDEEAASKLSVAPVRVEGVVSYDGPLPESIPVPEAGTVRHLVEVDPKTKGLKEAVVWLEGVPESAPAGNEAQDEPVVMDQQNYFFVPHVLAIRGGREVEFLNSDGANHGVTASSLEAKNQFNVTTPPGGRHIHRFVASKYPVAIGCPIHAAMVAWIYVFDHPHFAVTDEQGRFRFPTVPPGQYTLQVRHPDGGLRQQQEVVVRAGEPVHLRIEFHGGDLKVRGRAGTVPPR